MGGFGEGEWGAKSRLGVLLEHFGRIEDPRDVRRILHPLPEVLLLVVCGTIADRTRTDTRYFISSAALDTARAAHAVLGHWGIENDLHWVLDVLFRDDQSRPRAGHGARNMAIVRHFAFNLVRAASDRKSLKTRRKLVGWARTTSQASYIPQLFNLDSAP